MTIKKPYTITKMAIEEAHQVDNQFKTLYENKLESMVHMSGSNAKISSYRRQETGQFWVSGNGSQSVDRVVIFSQPFENVQSVIVNAVSPTIVADVIDITASQMTIRCQKRTPDIDVGVWSANVTTLCADFETIINFQLFNAIPAIFVGTSDIRFHVAAGVISITATNALLGARPISTTLAASSVHAGSLTLNGWYQVIGTRNFSSITTGSISVHYQVIGSNP